MGDGESTDAEKQLLNSKQSARGARLPDTPSAVRQQKYKLCSGNGRSSLHWTVSVI